MHVHGRTLDRPWRVRKIAQAGLAHETDRCNIHPAGARLQKLCIGKGTSTADSILERCRSQGTPTLHRTASRQGGLMPRVMVIGFSIIK